MEANATVKNLEIYLDDGSGVFEAATPSSPPSPT